MATFIIFLYLVQSSGALPMRLPRRASNSEEGMPYGHYGFPNLQMPHAGPMYGFGLPQYSQMIQLQQALSRQPLSWLPQNAAKPQQNHRETAHEPIFQLKPPQAQYPQQPLNPLQQPLPNYQHVTKQPEQPLQLPPVPGNLPPQMFPPFGNPMNPYQQFWPQGNFYGFYGYGGRQPYNSEELNEDEEPAKTEKEAPKAETPVTEPSNNVTTPETNSTIVDHNIGNATMNNTSIAGEHPPSPGITVDGNTPAPIIRIIHGTNISPGIPRASYHLVRSPNQENSLSNPQHRLYTVENSFPRNTRLPGQINKAPFTNSHNSGYSRNIPPIRGDNFSSRTAVQRENVAGEAKGIVHDSRFSIPKKEGVQQYNKHITLKNANSLSHHGKMNEREHLALPINKNNLFNHKIIIAQPRSTGPPSRPILTGNYNEYIVDTEYNRIPAIESPGPNFPRGILSSLQNIPANTQNNVVDRNSKISHTGITTVNHNNNALIGNDAPFMQDEVLPNTEDTMFYQNEGWPSDRGNSWIHRQSNTDMGTQNSRQHQETIYLVSSGPSVNIPGYSDNNPKLSRSLNSVWEKKKENVGSQQYNALGPGETQLYPENELLGQENNMPYSGQKIWNNIDFITPQYQNSPPHSYDLSRTSQAGQNRQELYINNDRSPLGERRYILISNQDTSKPTEKLNIPVNGPLFQIKHSPINSNNMDQNSYFTGFEGDPQKTNTNIHYISNRQFDPTENKHYSPGEQLHYTQNEPIYLQRLPYNEIQSWVNNPDEFPSGQNENPNFESYPSGMRIHSAHPKEIDHGGSRHYSCTIPISEFDTLNSVTGIPNSLLYVCCKLTHVEPGNPSRNVDNPHDIRITLKEYNDGVPYQTDRIHRQHTRNVIDPPKLNYNQDSNKIIPSCNMSNNNENMLISGGENPVPCETRTCNMQNPDYTYGSLDTTGSSPCHARGDADYYIAHNPGVLNSQTKNFPSEKPDLQGINMQEDGGMERNEKVNTGTGKLLRVLTCSKDRQKYNNIEKSKPNAFYLKPDIGKDGTATGVDTQDGSLLAENKNDPMSNVPDCLLL